MIDHLAPAAHARHAVSDETAFVLDAEEVRLLTEVGFLASASGDLARAEVIFGALREIRPGRAFPLIGLAVALMNKGRAADAAALLGEARGENDDEQALISAWQGLALQLAGHAAQSKKVLAAVASGKDGDGARLARSLLGEDTPTRLFPNMVSPAGTIDS